ncbi:MAG: SAM-dependent methyltransferase, partial [Actinomycetota bacterium]|nr:SAM-dependent methyltransferase [Actinomycetota bacterium]
LPPDRWRFAGFLPRRRADLRAALSEPGGTLVAFESPHRLAGTLATLAELDPQRPVAVCRELTKVHEEVVRGTARELAARFSERTPRGEVALVVGAPAERPGAEDEPPAGLEALVRLVDAGARPRAAAGAVAELTGESANRLYRALVAARGG